MSALNLPKPVNTYAGEDELRNPNGAPPAAKVAEDEDMGEYRPPRMSDKYKEGIIYPPGEMRKIIDKTAGAVAKTSKPAQLEDKIKETQKTDPRFAFLNDEDPYHQYYRWKLESTREEMEDAAKGIAPTPAPAAGTGNATPTAPEESKGPTYEPKPWEFKVDLPGVTALDLDILRLTALFHARRGRSFLEALSVREGRNYQFDFLRPTHSLFGYYNRMVESYQKVIQPPPGLVDSIVKADADPEAKWKTLEEARKRAEWERGRRRREDEKAKERDAEAEAFAAIDWQDFVTVETIEFTQADVDLELPPPMAIDKLREMSMAERRMAAMIMEEPAHPAAAAAAAGNDNIEEVDMEEDEDEEARIQRIKVEKEQARAREVQRAALESKGLKIKKDYVPKGIQRGANGATAKCPYCGQSIPESELSEHIRIELLDPRWKVQRQELEARRQQQQQLQVGADPSTSLRNLAAARTDMFGDADDESLRKRREEEDTRKKREREKIIWDGHTASAAKTESTFQTKFSAEDAARRQREAAGVLDKPVNTVGPQLGPGIQHQASAAALPQPPAAKTGATISADPSGPSRGAGPSMNPARAAMLAGAPMPGHHGGGGGRGGGGGGGAGMARPAPHDGGGDVQRAAKRARVDKLPNGQLYSEIDWQSLNPQGISVAVQLPAMPDKPEWKLDGSVVTITELPVSTLFATLRERIKRQIDADLPVSRLRLDYNGKVMNNSSTLASVNFGDGDVLTMTVRKK